MEKQAVQHIQETAHIPAVIDQLKAAGTQVPVITSPESMKVTSLERFMEHASRYRLNFSTTSINDFVGYNAEHDTSGAICFVNADSMSAHSVFDLGTIEAPGHQENSARLTLNKTAAFSALLRINGQQIKQKDGSDFIEDWADNITAVYTKDGSSLTPVQAANAIRDLSIEAAREINSTVSDFGESMSAMEKVEAKNQERIPSEIHFACEPYNGLKERTFKLRLSILTGSEKPMLVIRILRLESAEEDIAEEFKDHIAKHTNDLELKVFIGEIK